MSTCFRAVAGVVALALASLPGSVAVCAMLCASSGSTAAGMAGSAAHAHHTAEATRHDLSADSRLLARAVSVHRCGDHDANIQRWKTRLTPPRTDTAGALWACEATVLPRAALGQLLTPQIRSGHGPPPGPSSSVTPLVLRI